MQLVAVYGYGVHRCNLHGYVAAYVVVDAGLVEAADGRKFVAEVVVRSGRGGCEALVSAEFYLLACLAALGR